MELLESAGAVVWALALLVMGLIALVLLLTILYSLVIGAAGAIERRRMAESGNTPAAPRRTLYINSRRMDTDMPRLSYDQVVALAGFSALPSGIYTISWRVRTDEHAHKSGILRPGHAVDMLEGMRFDVVDTGETWNHLHSSN